MRYFKMNLSKMFDVTHMGQCKFDEPWKHFTRQTHEYILYFIKEGELFIEEDGKKYHLQEGEFLILEPNKPHKGYKAAPVTYYFIHFINTNVSVINNYSELDVAKDILMRRQISLSSDITESNYQDDSICMIPKTYKLNKHFEVYSLLDAACYELNQKGENFKLYSVLIATQILIKVNRLFNADAVGSMSQKSYSTVKKLMTYLEDNIQNKITIDEVENFMGLNYNYLNRIFKSSTGSTIKNYLNMIRVQQAQKLIRETPLTFIEISELVGIEDPFYFSKVFKSKTGLTPTQYKKETFYAVPDKETIY